MTPSGEVHPVAALFPMMTEEELDDLAADIQANGLLHPILLNSAGVLIDGRNRLAACGRVAYPPRFELFDGEPSDLIISANVKRRHLSLGQRAMATVLAKNVANTNLPYGWQAEEVARLDPADRVSMRSLLSHAYTISRHAPDLTDAVMAGGSLDQAYAEALRRKRQPEEQAERERLVAEARALAEENAARREEELRRSIDLVIEEIGPEVDILPESEWPDLSVFPFENGERRQPASKPAESSVMDEQSNYLQRLIAIRRSLSTLKTQPPVGADAWWPEGHIAAVRSAVSQIVTDALAIAKAHNSREQHLRMVR